MFKVIAGANIVAALQLLSSIAIAQTPNQAQAKFVSMLRATNAPAIYASPDTLPRFGYSYSVVVNNWTKPLEIGRFYPPDTGGDLTSQTRSMLAELDKRLETLGVTKGRIIRTSVLIKGTRFKDTLEVTGILDEYFADRKLIATNRPETYDSPARNLANMAELDRPGALVSMDVTILDPESAPTDMIARTLTQPSMRLAPLGGNRARTFLIEAVTAQQSDYNIMGRTSSEQVDVSLRHLDSVLAQIGAKRADIKQLNVDFVPSNNISQTEIAPKINRYFGAQGPAINFRAVGMSAIPGPSVCLSAEGAVIYPAER